MVDDGAWGAHGREGARGGLLAAHRLVLRWSAGGRQLAFAWNAAAIRVLDAAYLGWASADGSVIIGSEACAGHARFGVFRGGGFTPLPALPMSLPVQAGMLEGTFAW